MRSRRLWAMRRGSIRRAIRGGALRLCANSSRPALWRWCLALSISALVLIAGCTEPSKSPSPPRGSWVTGDAAAAREILEALRRIRGTPIARTASELAERLEGCRDFIAHVPDSNWHGLGPSLHCAADGEVPSALVAIRGAAPVAFILAIGASDALVGSLAIGSDGSIDGKAHVAAASLHSLSSLLVPGAALPGAPALSESNVVVHARVRPEGGLKIASRVGEDSQADRMFRLRSELFLGQILDGSWELAIYMPSREHFTPPMALALDHSLRPAAQKALDQFVSELEKTWPIHRTETEIVGLEGGCFFDLKILPDFAPCFVVNERSIVVGWNRASLEAALSKSPLADSSSLPSSLSERGGLVVNLGRLSQADRLMQALIGQEGQPAVDYVWESLHLEAKTDQDRLEMRLQLLAAPAAG